MVCWLGAADLRAARGEEAGLGPTAQGALYVKPSRVLILSTYAVAEANAYAQWLGAQTGAATEVRHVPMPDPTDYVKIYPVADQTLRELVGEKKGGRGEKITVHLSPGTPAMQSVWLLLGKTRYPVRLIKSSAQQGVVEAEIPFKISFDFIDPKMKEAADASLEQGSAALPPEGARFGDIVYRCAKMQTVVRQAKQVAARSVPVLILGESGTGKELFARAIHEYGRGAAMTNGDTGTAKAPFVPINCGAIPKDLVESTLFGHKRGAFTGAVSDLKGAFERADGGTLFLDELGEMPLDTQVKLLRVLQDKQVQPLGATRTVAVNVRLIAATNRDLHAEVSAGRFREDLFYRLAVAILWLPPLRERDGDLKPLVDALLDKVNGEAEADEPGYQRKKLSPKARDALSQHGWPGNVRELENTLMRAAVWSEGTTITEKDVQPRPLSGEGASATVLDRPLGDGFSIEQARDDVERHYLKRALEEARGNKTQAAKLLGLKSHQVVSNWMERLKVGD